MFILYDFIFLIFTLIYLPIYLFKGKFHNCFSRRLGFLPRNLVLDRPIWIHAVSVGEAAAVRGLVGELRKTYPAKKFVISTVTPTGNKIVQGFAKEDDFVTYLPLDLSFIVRSVINRVNPCLFVIAETEIWPNLISHLHKKKIPVITVNGRISDGSFQGYFRIRFLLAPILKKISFFCVQTETDRKRFIALGVPQDKIQVTGNMKFDLKDFSLSKNDYAGYKKKLCLSPDEKLLIAGSTHPQEEEIVLRVYKDLLNTFPKLKLLIAPRHPQRSKDIEKIISSLGFRTVFISQATGDCKTCITKAVYILDTVGELTSYYAIADIVFVGGSLIKKGGHNILEPAASAKPIIFGPHMFNFRDIADLFLNNGASVKVKNSEELETIITELLSNQALAMQMSVLAQQLILQNRGATQRSTEIIKKYCLQY